MREVTHATIVAYTTQVKVYTAECADHTPKCCEALEIRCGVPSNQPCCESSHATNSLSKHAARADNSTQARRAQLCVVPVVRLYPCPGAPPDIWLWSHNLPQWRRSREAPRRNSTQLEHRNTALRERSCYNQPLPPARGRIAEVKARRTCMGTPCPDRQPRRPTSSRVGHKSALGAECCEDPCGGVGPSSSLRGAVQRGVRASGERAPFAFGGTPRAPRMTDTRPAQPRKRERNARARGAHVRAPQAARATRHAGCLRVASILAAIAPRSPPPYNLHAYTAVAMASSQMALRNAPTPPAPRLRIITPH